jgi:hypothetical protein
VAAVIYYDLGDELGVFGKKQAERGGGKGVGCGGIGGGGRTWIDQQTAPNVPRTFAAIGTSIVSVREFEFNNYMS